jgi:hypothetical protein
MNTDIILLWGTGESERVILEITDLGTTDKDVFTGSGVDVFFFDLDFEDFGGMEDELGDVRDVSGWKSAYAHWLNDLL